MKYVLEALQPQNVFRLFEEISRIPRGSGNEAAVSRYVADFAAGLDYEAVSDEAGNAAVNVPASPGMENCGKLILQAHMDMVCEKEAGSAHDFLTDPIELYIEDGFVKAKGTTLGADDGIGMALALAIMEDKTLRHPAMQFLFTTGEEIVFQGAKAMDKDLIDGNALISLDCSRDDILMVSCAGISIHRFRRRLTRKTLDARRQWQSYSLTIKGLSGGHSAYAIAENRGNGILLLGRVIEQLQKRFAEDICVVSAEAGTLINVIPAVAKVSVCCGKEHAGAFENAFDEIAKELRQAYAQTEPGLQLLIEERELRADETCISREDIKSLLALLGAFPYGAHTMQDSQMAESSACVSILREEKGMLVAEGSIRSNVETLHDDLEKAFEEAAAVSGFQHVRQQREPAWEYREESPLKQYVTACWETVRGETPGFFRPHASVEGAVFIDKMAQKGRSLDVIGMGCRTCEVHTPKERLEIASVGRTYELLRYIVENFNLQYIE